MNEVMQFAQVGCEESAEYLEAEALEAMQAEGLIGQPVVPQAVTTTEDDIAY